MKADLINKRPKRYSTMFPKLVFSKKLPQAIRRTGQRASPVGQVSRREWQPRRDGHNVSSNTL
ncbi:memb4 [Vibrio phage VSK]|uniref:Memb4 n=1 Tax=Vibrio phage VSK TaxID=181604 RepID=Q8W6C9_9VIRU|nr:memb4 [Vibrio phage VSK]AAL49745.1 memb4 [Vibrio phage VSK]